MRYGLILAGLGEYLARSMVDSGVARWDVEKWMIRWEEALADIPKLSPGTSQSQVYLFANFIQNYQQLLVSAEASENEQ